MSQTEKITTEALTTGLRQYLPKDTYILFTPQDSLFISPNGDDIIRSIQALEQQKKAAMETITASIERGVMGDTPHQMSVRASKQSWPHDCPTKIDHIAPNGEPV